MSHLGQTRPWRHFLATAAVPLKPDVDRRDWHGRKVPILLQKSKIEGRQFSRQKTKQVEIAD
jgi:hypothetical protein